tara:strand:+ start:2296 stop:2808 length:513 start_codon:yes stop_codon:yes gene_type:complete
MVNVKKVKEGFSGKVWKKDDKHRIYVVGPDGEVGFFDLKTGEFSISPKSDISFGISDSKNACLEISQGKKKIYLGIVEEKKTDSEEILSKFKESIAKIANITSNHDKTRVEINLGPTMELKIKGKSHWAKANFTIGVESSEEIDIENLYDATSDLVNCMLEMEINKLKKM